MVKSKTTKKKHLKRKIHGNRMSGGGILGPDWITRRYGGQKDRMEAVRAMERNRVVQLREKQRRAEHEKEEKKKL